MTILSKIKTLIEYAKFGVSWHKYISSGTTIIDFEAPKGIEMLYSSNFNFSKDRIRTFKGDFKRISGNGLFQASTTLEIIDLPKCISHSGWGMFNNNTVLRIVKEPSMRNIAGDDFKNCTALEYVEFGALINLGNTVFKGCTALHTVIVGEGTACNLFLYHSEALTQECLHNIIDNLADMTGLTAPTFYVGEENLAKIESEYLTKLTQKNWVYQ